MSDEYVYTLAFEDGRVFYVGKGSGQGCTDRIRVHLYEARGKREKISKVAMVIRFIWLLGGRVVIRKKYCDNALLLEKQLIAQYGYEHLVNDPWSKHPHLCQDWKQRIDHRTKIQKQKLTR